MTTSEPTTPVLDLVGPFISSAELVLDTMLRSDCVAGQVQPVQPGHRMHTVTSVIGLSGGLAGAVSISIHAEGAFQILERMTGIEATDVDDFVRDAVGEIANMVAGQGKRELSQFHLKLGLPQVIVGADYCVYSPRWARHDWVPLQTDLGEIMLTIGFDSHART